MCTTVICCVYADCCVISQTPEEEDGMDDLERAEASILERQKSKGKKDKGKGKEKASRRESRNNASESEAEDESDAGAAAGTLSGKGKGHFSDTVSLYCGQQDLRLCRFR
jgi:hypothetical protein